MRLTDIMSNMDLDIYPTIGLVIFLAAFVAVACRVLTSKRRDNERMAAMPLADDGDISGEPTDGA